MSYTADQPSSETETMRYTYLTGRCANGWQRDSGTLYHAVPGTSEWSKALCGAQPGRRSNGWSDYRAAAPTCPRCLAVLAKRQQQLSTQTTGVIR